MLFPSRNFYLSNPPALFSDNNRIEFVNSVIYLIVYIDFHLNDDIDICREVCLTLVLLSMLLVCGVNSVALAFAVLM